MNQSENQRKNLKANTDRTPSERQELARKAGQASGAARRKKRSLQEWAQVMMQIPATDPKLIAMMDAAGIPKEEQTAGAEMLLAVQNKTIQKGNHDALKVIRDTAGEVPVQRVAIGNADDLRTLSEADLRAAVDGAYSD